MKTTIKIEKEIDVKFVEVTLPVNFGEEDMPNNFPLRTGDIWHALINIDRGKIVSWPQGEKGEFYMKVCDGGTYELLDENMDSVAKIDNNYVSNRLIPGEYGDYVHFKIDQEGFIINWSKNPDLSEFFSE